MIEVAIYDAEGVRTNDASISTEPTAVERLQGSSRVVTFDAAAVRAVDKLVVIAKHAMLQESGRVELPTNRPFPPLVAVRMQRHPDIVLLGVVLTRADLAADAARVSVENYPHEAAVTDASGRFRLPAHAPAGAYVKMVVEYRGRTHEELTLVTTEPTSIRLPHE